MKDMSDIKRDRRRCDIVFLKHQTIDFLERRVLGEITLWIARKHRQSHRKACRTKGRKACDDPRTKKTCATG